MSADELSKRLWPAGIERTKKSDPDSRLIDAMQKALDNTTPEHAGTPWDKEEKELDERSRGYYLPEAS